MYKLFQCAFLLVIVHFYAPQVLFGVHARISHLLWLAEQLAILSSVPDARSLLRLYKRISTLPSKVLDSLQPHYVVVLQFEL